VLYITSILESFLGDYRKHNEGTGQISFDCPACSDDKGMPEGDGKGNLEINYNKDVFKCWVCKDTHDMYGSISKLIKKHGSQKNLKDYKLFKPDAFEYGDKKSIAVELPEGFKLLKDCSSKDFKYNAAINYLNNRGITDDIIKKFNIGYTTKGKFFNRIIVPSYDSDDRLNYFIARWFDKQPTKLKYLNPDVEKQTIIFNENKINWDATIYLVEGVTDHLVVPNSIPLLGKYISDILLEKIHDNANSKIVILLDGDALEDAKNLYCNLNFGKLKGRIRICNPPLDYDPSKIHELRGKRGIIALLKRTTTLDKLNYTC
jgi:DNA primase